MKNLWVLTGTKYCPLHKKYRRTGRAAEIIGRFPGYVVLRWDHHLDGRLYPYEDTINPRTSFYTSLEDATKVIIEQERTGRCQCST